MKVWNIIKEWFRDNMKNLESYITLQDEKLLLEMAQVGKMNNNLTIYIRSNDPGNIPHFHIVDSKTLGDKFHTCIEIEKNNYFHHTGKEGVLSSKERKELDRFLKEKHKNRSYSNWTYLLQLWNDNNSHVEVDELQDQPDYKNIAK